MRKATVLYDDDCGFCKWSLNRILAWDRRGRLDAMPIQGPDGDLALAAIEAERRLDSFHIVAPDGELRSGGAALPVLFGLLPGGAPLAWLTRTFPRLSEWGYGLVARNRTRLSRLLGIDSACEVRRP